MSNFNIFDATPAERAAEQARRKTDLAARLETAKQFRAIIAHLSQLPDLCGGGALDLIVAQSAQFDARSLECAQAIVFNTDGITAVCTDTQNHLFLVETFTARLPGKFKITDTTGTVFIFGEYAGDVVSEFWPANNAPEISPETVQNAITALNVELQKMTAALSDY